MTDRFESNPAGELPPDLAALDRELSGFRVEERASFGPELRAELAREAVRMRGSRPSLRRFMPRAVAASVAAILVATLAAPPARGALARFWTRIQTETVAEAPGPESLPAPSIDVDQPDLGTTVLVESSEAFTPTRIVRLGAEPGPAVVPPITFPELQNRLQVEALVQSLYPQELQSDGIGGDVRLLLWVDSLGVVEEAQVGESSGLAALDRAATATAPYLRFEPARRQGAAVGSWVQFDVRFQPTTDATALPSVEPLDQPAAPDVVQPDLIPEWMRAGDPLAAPPSGGASDVDLLRAALGNTREIEERWGSLEGLLSGEAPESELPLRWRDEAAAALEEAIVRDPRNPAPFLALGRIRKRQGLRVDARRLFERGIDRAEADNGSVSGLVVADLYYENGAIVAEDWLPWMNLGQVHANHLAAASCPRAAAPGVPGAPVGGGALIAWNYLCPSQFDQVMRDGFESLESLKHGVREDMLRSFYAAVEVHPAHVEAQVAVLLDLADTRSYEDLLAGAQRFALASGGEPQALLLSGLALHRLGRSQEAMTQFGLAFQRLAPEDVSALRDLRPLLGKDAARGLAPVGTRGRDDMERRFWAPLDPLLATPVNEREAEHLARATYAHLRFGGTATDAGRVWIRYGRPHAVRTFRDGAGLRTSFWDYGPGPDVTFRRPAASLSYELTSEGTAYVEELMDVFPHGYDAGRGNTLPIVSQIARFRTAGTGTLDVEIHAKLPEALVTDAGDSLEVGLYLAGPGGERWVVTRRRIPADSKEIHLTAEPTATSDRLVLEMYHAGTNQAARLESPLSREGFDRQGPALSDLMLVAPIAPFSPEDSNRSSSSTEALGSPHLMAGERAGVVFELYDLPGRSVGYSMRAQAEQLSSGEVFSVDLKPAGELEFRGDWTRSNRTGDPLSEYVTLNTSELEAGQYLLRLTVALDTGGGSLTSTRVIDVR